MNGPASPPHVRHRRDRVSAVTGEAALLIFVGSPHECRISPHVTCRPRAAWAFLFVSRSCHRDQSQTRDISSAPAVGQDFAAGGRLRVGRCPDIKPRALIDTLQLARHINPEMKGNSLCVRSCLADASSAGQTAQVRAGPAGDEQAAYQVVDSRAGVDDLRSLVLTGEQCTDGLLAAAPLDVRPSGVSPVPGPPGQAARRAVRGDTRRVRRRPRAAGAGGGSPGRKVRQYGRTAATQLSHASEIAVPA